MRILFQFFINLPEREIVADENRDAMKIVLVERIITTTRRVMGKLNRSNMMWLIFGFYSCHRRRPTQEEMKPEESVFGNVTEKMRTEIRERIFLTSPRLVIGERSRMNRELSVAAGARIRFLPAGGGKIQRKPHLFALSIEKNKIDNRTLLVGVLPTTLFFFFFFPSGFLVRDRNSMLR